MSSITLFPYSTSKDDVEPRTVAYDYSNVLSFHTGVSAWNYMNVEILQTSGDRHAVFFTTTYTANTVTGVTPFIQKGGSSITSISHQFAPPLAYGINSAANADFICMGGVVYNVATTSANSIYGTGYGAASGGTTTNTAMLRSGLVVLKLGDNDVGNSMSSVGSAVTTYGNTGWGAVSYLSGGASEFWQTRNTITVPNTGPYAIIGSCRWSSPTAGGTPFLQARPLTIPAFKIFGPYSGSGRVSANQNSYSTFTNGWVTQNPSDTGTSDSQLWSAAFVTDAQKNSQYRLLYTGGTFNFNIGVREASLVGLYLPDFQNYYYTQNIGALQYHLDANNRILSGNSVSANSFISESFYIKNPANKHLMIASITINSWSGINNYIRLYNETTGEDYNDSQPFKRTNSQQAYADGHQNFISRVVTFANNVNKISWQSYISPAQPTVRFIYNGAASIIILDLGTT